MNRRREGKAKKVYVQGEKQAPPPPSSRGPTRKRPPPSYRPPPPQAPRHAPLFPSFRPDLAVWPERDLAPLELTDAQSRFIAGTVSDIRDREREAQRRRRTALSSTTLADPPSAGSSSSESSTVKRQKVETGHHPHGAAADGGAPSDAGGRAGVRIGDYRPRQRQRLFRTPRGGVGRSFVEYVDSYPEVPQFVATSGSMITHGSQSFLETVALSSSPSDPHLPLTVFDLVRTECLGSLYGMLALALHGLGIVEEEAGDEGDLPSSGTKTSGFSGPVSSDLDASSLVPRVASMVVSGSEDESDGKDYPRPSVLSGRRDGEGEKMNLAANRARDEPSHLCITLPCKMPLGQDVTVIYMDDLPSRCFVGILTPSELESTSDLPRGQMVRMSDGELCSRVFRGVVCFGAL